MYFVTYYNLFDKFAKHRYFLFSQNGIWAFEPEPESVLMIMEIIIFYYVAVDIQDDSCYTFEGLPFGAVPAPGFPAVGECITLEYHHSFTAAQLRYFIMKFCKKIHF